MQAEATFFLGTNSIYKRICNPSQFKELSVCSIHSSNCACISMPVNNKHSHAPLFISVVRSIIFSAIINTSYQLQSCLIAHQLTLYCSLLCQEASSQSRVIVYRLKLEQPNVAKNTIELVHGCGSDVLQCYLFTSHGKTTAVKIIENKHSSSCFLEFCSLNNAATSNFFRKEYSFIIKLISVIPLHSAAYNKHVLIVYYDGRSCIIYLFNYLFIYLFIAKLK